MPTAAPPTATLPTAGPPVEVGATPMEEDDDHSADEMMPGAPRGPRGPRGPERSNYEEADVRACVAPSVV